MKSNYLLGVKMSEKLELNINKFGPINQSCIEISKINVVGGINGSGKSFVAKLIYCFLIGLSKEGKLISNNAVKSLFMDFINGYEFQSNNYSHLNIKNQAYDLMMNWDDTRVDYNYFHEFLTDFKKLFGNDDLRLIEEVISFYKNDYDYIEHTIKFMITQEFSHLENFIDSKVSLNVDKHQYKLIFNNHDFEMEVPDSNNVLFDNVIYMDSPSILDYQSNFANLPFHYVQLFKQLSEYQKSNFHDRICFKKTNDFKDYIKNQIDGEFRYDKANKKFIFHSNGQYHDIINVASGYKQLGVIQLLLNNKLLSPSSMLIIDEPEINLHPKFQVMLAELLVLIVKELDINLYINSHSPHFIEAMEVYSAKYGLENETKFYLSKKENDKFNLKEVSRNDLVVIYDDLGDSYDKLDDVRAENFFNGIL